MTDNQEVKARSVIVATYANLTSSWWMIAKSSPAILIVATVLDFAFTLIRMETRGGEFTDISNTLDWIYLLIGEASIPIPYLVFVPLLIELQRRILGETYSTSWYPKLRKSTLRYAITGFVTIVVFLSFMIVALYMLVNVPIEVSFTAKLIGIFCAYLLAFFLLVRVSLLLPAIAIDRTMSLKNSWQKTHRAPLRNAVSLITTTTGPIFLYAATIAILYMPALANINESATVLGKVLKDSMIYTTLITPPIVLFLSLVFTSCTAEIHKRMNNNEQPIANKLTGPAVSSQPAVR
jgi:hypothetical protein